MADDPREPGSQDDPRIEAVRAVLAGGDVEEVARRLAVDSTLLERWVSMFVEAGTAAVTNRPNHQTAVQRDRFLAAFAFEVRAPLTVAMGWADLMGSGDLNPESYVGTAGRLQSALDDLSERIIDAELLVAASLGGLVLEKTRVTAGEICTLPGLPPVLGAGPNIAFDVDRDLFRCIVRDLWNAAGQRPAPTSRGIEAVVRGPWVELSITRRGDPIDVDHLQALFEPFDHDLIGSGVTVGLYLARALSVAHGGTIGVDQDDDGAVFWVRVPRHSTHQGPGPTTNGGTR